MKVTIYLCLITAINLSALSCNNEREVRIRASEEKVIIDKFTLSCATQNSIIQELIAHFNKENDYLDIKKPRILRYPKYHDLLHSDSSLYINEECTINTDLKGFAIYRAGKYLRNHEAYTLQLYTVRSNNNVLKIRADHILGSKMISYDAYYNKAIGKMDSVVFDNMSIE